MGIAAPVLLAALLLAPFAGHADSAALAAPTPFEPRPADAELAPRNANERDAGVIILDHRIEFSGLIRQWFGRNASVKRHRVRYLIRDSQGVEAIKQHTFFGDESNVTISDVRGQTISPDGSVHPVNPDLDIHELDIKVGRREADFLRTVHFPRVEPGAILDLAWTATSGQPTLETIRLHALFPTRSLRIKAQGKLSGGAQVQPGFGLQPYWVPFVISQAPPGTIARLSSLMDLELSATNLPVITDEPFSPPRVRTSAMLGLATRSLPGRKWREHVYLFDSPESLPPQVEREVVWGEASLDDHAPLAEFDEVGLQLPPKSFRNARGFEYLQLGLKGMTRDYRRFSNKPKTGESAAQLEQIAPSSLDWHERVDRIFRYARDQVRVDPRIVNWQRLDKLKRRGAGNPQSVRYYVKYLLDRAGIDNDIVLAFSRRDLPMLTIFDAWEIYVTRRLFIEARGPDGAVRYLEPDDPLADSWSFSSGYLGGLLFRDSGDPKVDWPLDRMPANVRIRNRTVLRFEADAAAMAAGNGMLKAVAELHGATANRMRWSLGRPTEETDLELLRQNRMDTLRGWLGGWTGAELPEDFRLPVEEPDADLWAPYSVRAELPWQANVQPLDSRMILPAFPEVLRFQNHFVAQRRQQPLWLEGGDYEVSLSWKLPPGMAPAQLRQSDSQGPGGLEVRLSQTWDEAQSRLTSTLRVSEPYMLPASQYPEVRELFATLQRESRMSLLIKPKP